jgi:hypothetical protein
LSLDCPNFCSGRAVAANEVAPVIWESIQGNKSCFDGEKYTFMSGVHCEALLLLKYHSCNPNFPPALSYIGVSKSSYYASCEVPVDGILRRCDLKRILLKTQDKMRSGSNSTNASAASEDVTTPLESVESARSFLRNKIQETKAMR